MDLSVEEEDVAIGLLAGSEVILTRARLDKATSAHDLQVNLLFVDEVGFQGRESAARFSSLSLTIGTNSSISSYDFFGSMNVFCRCDNSASLIVVVVVGLAAGECCSPRLISTRNGQLPHFAINIMLVTLSPFCDSRQKRDRLIIILESDDIEMLLQLVCVLMSELHLSVQ